MASGANVGKNFSVFEAVHGTAPDIAGQNKANPTALLFSAISMLHHLGKTSQAAAIQKALMKTLSHPETRTGDLKGPLGNRQFADAIISQLAGVSHA